jgi:hypothetical protein
MATRAALLAEYLSNHQPLPVRERLLRDHEFLARFGLSARTVITLGGLASIDMRYLFTAVRRVLADREPKSIVDLDGRRLLVQINERGALIAQSVDAEHPMEACLDDLVILSPCREERTEALGRLLDRFGPTSPDFADLRRIAGERELKDEETGRLFTERLNGVAAVQARVAEAFKAEQATLDDLIPDSLLYFEQFCGPDPQTTEPEAYLTAVLPEYRQELLRRDLVRGLDICLLGALRDDLAPGSWIEHVDDDELWHALSACNPTRDPFSLLGALDIALARQHDERYRIFSDEAIAKLVQDELPRPDGTDTYEVISLFAELVLDRINTLEGGAGRQPYWKRMCAWMQAGLLARLATPLVLDVERLGDWVRANRSAAGTYARILDLRREPMFRAGEISGRVLREEVLGRLIALRSRNAALGRVMPRSSDIDDAMSRLDDCGGPFAWALPGPLEGHRRPVELGGRSMPEEALQTALNAFSKEPAGPAWSMLAYLSQYFDLGETLLARVRAAVACVTLETEEAEREKRLERLTNGCLVAAAQRDMELARSIATTVLAASHTMRSGGQAVAMLRILVFASAAFATDPAWAEWLEEQLTELAARLPSGEASKAFLEHLREVKSVVPLPLCIHSRAEALASAAS